jgi:hypothetical protein
LGQSDDPTAALQAASGSGTSIYTVDWNTQPWCTDTCAGQGVKNVGWDMPGKPGQCCGVVPTDYAIICKDGGEGYCLGSSDPCPSSMKAYWQFDEVSGLSAADSVGPNTGSLQNMVGNEWSGGKLNNALYFDGTDDFVDFGNDLSIDIRNKLTVQAWFYSETTDEYRGIVSSGAPGSYVDWGIYTYTSFPGSLRMGIRNPTFTGQTISSTNAFSMFNWHHGAFTFDGNTGSAIIYIDGQPRSSTFPTGDIQTTAGWITRVGRDRSATISFQGMIDEVAIYNDVLTPAEIQASRNKVMAGQPYCVPGPVDEACCTGGTGTECVRGGACFPAGSIFGEWQCGALAVNTWHDVTAPTVSVTGAPPSWQTSTAPANVQCVDGGSGCVSGSYMLDLHTSDPGVCSTTYSDYTVADGTAISGHVWVCGAAQDAGGNTGYSSPVEFLVDVTVPTVTVADSQGSTAGWINIDDQASVSCSDSDSGCDATSYLLLTYGADPGVCPNTYASYTLGSPQTISSHRWVCGAAKDNVGLEGFSSPTEFMVDKTAPTITDDYAYDGVWINSAQTVTLNPSDFGGSGIRDVRWCQGAGCSPGNILASPYQLSYPGEQDIIIRYQAWDNANNPSAIGQFNVKIDLSPPTASVTGAPPIGVWTNVPTPANIACVDAGTPPSGCNASAYKLKIYSSNPGVCSLVYSDYDKSPPQQITSHSWICGAVRDFAGNEDFSNTPEEFQVDAEIPVAWLIPLPEWTNNTFFNVEWNGFDTGGSGLVEYQVYYEELDTGVVTIPWVQWLLAPLVTNAIFGPVAPLAVQQNRTYAFRVRGRDNAGNIGPWSGLVNITTIDTFDPLCTMNVPPPYVPSIFQVSWDGDDNNPALPGNQSGIKAYDLRINDGGGWVDSLDVLGADTQASYFMDEGDGNTTYDSHGSSDGTIYGNTKLMMHFDEYSGPPKDNSPYANDGVIIGHEPTWQYESDCVSGNCMFFDGFDDYILLPMQPDIGNDNEGTISAWVKGNLIGMHNIFSYSDLSVAHRFIQFRLMNDKLQFYYMKVNEAPGPNNFPLVGTTSIGPGWNHVAATSDGSTVRMYINGVEETAIAVGTNLGQWFDDLNPFVYQTFIGKHDSTSFPGPTNFWAGWIDEFAIHSRALSLPEIQAMFNEGKAKYTDWVPGQSGTALQLDGNDDYVEATIDVSEVAYTAELWFNTSDPNAGLFSVDDGVLGSLGHDRHIYLNNGQVCARIFNVLSEAICTPVGTSYADDSWHHVAHVFGGAVGGQKLFVDGTELASGAYASSGFGAQTGINIGFSNDAANTYLDGQIDGVKIYNRDLTPGEIRASALGIPQLGGCLLTGPTSADCQGVDTVNYQFQCRATDNAGNIGPWSAQVDTTVDNTAPVTTPLMPGAGRQWANSSSPSPPNPITVDLEWRSTDVGGVKCYYIKWQNCTHIANQANNGVCSAWDPWYYVIDHSSGNTTNCLTAQPADCAGIDCQKHVLFNGTGIDQFNTIIRGDINTLEIYNYSMWSEDVSGNVEVHYAVDPIIDNIFPSFEYDVFDDNGNSIKGQIKLDGDATNWINISSNATDSMAGIEEHYIEYCITQNDVYSCGSFSGGSAPSWGGIGYAWTDPTIPYGPNTIIKYRIRVKDRAGNWNYTLDYYNPQWNFIVTHMLGNFVTHNLFLSLGQSYDLRVQTRNLQSAYDNITIKLDGYTMAYFLNTSGAGISNNGRTLKTGLNPNEDRTFYVRVLSSQVRDTPYILNLTATSEIDPTLKDVDDVKITIKYPASFPGLTGWAIMILILLSVALYWKVDFRRR